MQKVFAGIVLVLMLLASNVSGFAQDDIGTGSRDCPIGGTLSEPECAAEDGKSNDQKLGTPVSTTHECDTEVCASRAISDRGSWSGISAKALLPAIQGGDIVPRVKAMFTNVSFYNDDYILMMACENVRFQRDPCFLVWKVWPSRQEQIGNYYNYVGRDRDKCWGIGHDKKFYTRAEFYSGDGGDAKLIIESDDLKYPRACSL
jgi:hypothetical protein